VATFRKPIVGFTAAPDGTGECFGEVFSVLATNDVWANLHIVRFGASNSGQPTVRHGIYGGFTVPKNYVGNATLVIVWSASITSGNVVWDFDYRAVGGNDSESLDQAGTQESVSVTDAAPGASWRRLEATVSLTSANLAVDDLVEFYFVRDGTDGSDTMAGSAVLFDLLFQYTD
jgi:hypothetical protein